MNVTKCLTLSLTAIEIAETLGKGPRLSQKIDWLLKDYAEAKRKLVVYADIEQKANGTPTILKPGAERIYSWSGFHKGWGDGELAQVVFQGIRKCPEGKRAVGKLTAYLEDAGIKYQLVDDPEADIWDLWAAKEKRCGEDCPYINKIAEAVRKAERGEL